MLMQADTGGRNISEIIWGGAENDSMAIFFS